MFDYLTNMNNLLLQSIYNQIKKIKSDLLTVFVLTTLVFSIIYYPFIFKDFIYAYLDIGADTVSNYWPLMTHISDLFHKGNFSFYSFNIGIGTSIFNNAHLFLDPFNWPIFIGDPSDLANNLIFITYLKTFLSCIIGYKLLILFKIEKWISVLGSLLFGFSGYSLIWGQHYNFHSGYFFSLLFLYGSEKLLSNHKEKTILCISTACLLLTSIYISYMVFIFSVIYLPIRAYFLKLNLFHSSVLFFKAGIIGLFISCFGFLPALLELLNSPRITGEAPTALFEFFNFNVLSQYLLKMLSPNLLGIGSYSQSIRNYYEDPNLFIGIFSFLLLLVGFLFILKGAARIFTMLFFVYILTSVFFCSLMNAFASTYFRWNYLLVFILIIASMHFLNEILKKPRVFKMKEKSILVVMPFIIFTTSKLAMHWKIEDVIFTKSFLFTITSYYAFLYLLLCTKSKTTIFLIFTLTCIELMFVGHSAVVDRSVISNSLKMKNGQPDLNPSYKTTLKDITDYDNGVFRIHFTDWKTLNEPLHYNYLGVTAYSSLNDSGYLNYLKFIEGNKFSESYNWIRGPGENSSQLKLLGVKYLNSTKEIIDSDLLFLKKNQNHYTYLVNDNEHEFVKFRTQEAPIACYHKSPCPKKMKLEFIAFTQTTANNDCSKYCENPNKSFGTITHFEFKNGSIKFQSTVTGLQTGILSIPYHKGFKLLIDEKEQKIFPVDGGLIGFHTIEGTHRYIFNFHQPGLLSGFILSLLGFLMLLFTHSFTRKRRLKP